MMSVTSYELETPRYADGGPEINLEPFRKIPYQSRDRCLVCDSRAPESLIRLKELPLTEIYVDRRVEEKLGTVDQEFQFCAHCGHGQLKNVIDVELQYGEPATYFFRSSQSASGRKTAGFFLDFFEKITGERQFKTILEIGCNDLYLLNSLRPRAEHLLGVDPILRGHEESLSDDKLTAIGDFYEKVHLDREVDVVICKDALEHIDEPKHFLKKIIDRASPETLFFFQFPLLDTLVADGRFDQIFHQHLNYFSFKSILHMLGELGCSLLDYRINYDHWAGILIAFQKGENNDRFTDPVWNTSAEVISQRYQWFKTEMVQTGRWLQAFRGELLYGYGAALMLPVLSYHLEDDLSCLRCVIDDDLSKDGHYYINLPVPIVHGSRIKDIDKAVVLLTAISSQMTTRSILTKLFPMNPKYIIYPLRTI